MNIIEVVEKNKVLGGAAKVTLELLKTIKTIAGYKLDLFFEIGDIIFDPNKYKQINDAEDFYDDSFIFIEGIGDVIQKATVNLVKNAGHGIKDVLTTISDNEVINYIGDDIEEATNTAAEFIDDTLNTFGEGFYAFRDALKRFLFE